MAQDFTASQKKWATNFSNNVVGLMANVVAINDLFDQATADGYLTGGAQPITDATIQSVLPAATAAAMNTAMGAFKNANQISAIIATNRQSLELMRSSN